MGRVATIRQRNADYQVTWRSVEQLIPYARNARTHSDEQVAQIAASVREFGWTNPVLVDEADGIIAGHGRVMAARKLGMDQVPVIVLSGLTEAQKRAYIIADNKLALNAGWDEEMLRAELADLRESGFDVNLTGFDPDEIAELDGTEDPPKLYTDKMQTPVYVPTGDCPAIADLADQGRAQALIDEIEASDLDPEHKAFLKLAAARHVVFDYRAIAEFYAHASAPVQRLMEASALVIIDFDQAIERGYVQLSDRLQDIYDGSYDDDEHGDEA